MQAKYDTSLMQQCYLTRMRLFDYRVSYIEIYNETVKDLLDVKKENIKIHENYEGNIIVDATEKVTSSPEEVLEAMRQVIFCTIQILAKP